MENLRFVRRLRRLESLTEASVISLIRCATSESMDESLAFGFQGPVWVALETPLTVFEIYSFCLALESSVTKSQTLIGQKNPPSGPDDLSRPESDHSIL